MVASTIRKGRVLLLCFLLLPALVGASETTQKDSGLPRKVALLVGISHYSPAGGWANLHTETDLERMHAALEAQGFAPAEIHTLKDKDADRKGIEDAFRRHLIEGATPGAVAFFHYSGHGQRITDDDHDEVDGYDEALVPFDAPKRLIDGYEGGKHLRDDDLHDWLRELRLKIGPRGDVVVSLDSCFSGAATRGLAARGALEPLGPPQAPREGSLGADLAGGFVEGRGVATRGEENLAPFIFISSARHDELAFETRDEAGATHRLAVLRTGLGARERGHGHDLPGLARRGQAHHGRPRTQPPATRGPSRTAASWAAGRCLKSRTTRS